LGTGGGANSGSCLCYNIPLDLTGIDKLHVRYEIQEVWNARSEKYAIYITAHGTGLKHTKTGTNVNE